MFPGMLLATPAPQSGKRKYDSIQTPGKTPTAGKTPKSCDRFIPSRSGMNKEFIQHQLSNKKNKENSSGNSNIINSSTKNTKEFRDELGKMFFDEDIRNSSLTFKAKQMRSADRHQRSSSLYALQSHSLTSSIKKTGRIISGSAERILDAPDLVDDYYLNLLDWSSLNKLAVGLKNIVYLWDPVSSTIEQLCQLNEETYVTSISFTRDGRFISVGNSNNTIAMYDVERLKQVRNLKGHIARVGALSWNGHILSSGGADAKIFHHDVRKQEHLVATLNGHEQEICGLKWSNFEGRQLASGSNDNKCIIWDQRKLNPLCTFETHTSAVKALAWSPHQKNLLATGAGTSDKHIRFFSSITNTCLQAIDTESQVCSLIWSPTEKELLSSHGFSQNQLTLWSYPSMNKIKELKGHSSRVLHTAISPDNMTVCSAAADETLRFWKVFEKKNLLKNNSCSLTNISLR